MESREGGGWAGSGDMRCPCQPVPGPSRGSQGCIPPLCSLPGCPQPWPSTAGSLGTVCCPLMAAHAQGLFAQMCLLCFSPFLDCLFVAIIPLLCFLFFSFSYAASLLPHSVTSLPHISPFAPSSTLPPCHFFPSAQCRATDALLLFCVLPFIYQETLHVKVCVFLSF